MAKIWFTKGNTSIELDKDDLNILNAVARELHKSGFEMSHDMLLEIRSKYEHGMSAYDLIEIIKNDYS